MSQFFKAMFAVAALSSACAAPDGEPAAQEPPTFESNALGAKPPTCARPGIATAAYPRLEQQERVAWTRGRLEALVERAALPKGDRQPSVTRSDVEAKLLDGTRFALHDEPWGRRWVSVQVSTEKIWIRESQLEAAELGLRLADAVLDRTAWPRPLVDPPSVSADAQVSAEGEQISLPTALSDVTFTLFHSAQGASFVRSSDMFGGVTWWRAADLASARDEDAASALTVIGGEVAERALVEGSFARIPRALYAPNALPLQVMLFDSAQLYASSGDPRKAFNLGYVEQPGSLQDRIVVTTGTLPGGPLRELRDGLVRREGLDPEMLFGAGRLLSLLRHESGHRFHFYNRELVNEFLSLRFYGAYSQLSSDPAYATLKADLSALRSQEKEAPLTSDQQERKLALISDLYAIFVELRLPTRGRNDMHAVDDAEGREYFAIALELQRHYPQAFRALLTQPEQIWLERLVESWACEP